MDEFDAYPHTPLEQAVVERVVDGDTLLVRTVHKNERQRVRLVGCNAPESVAPEAQRNCAAGVESSHYLKQLLAPGTTVWLQRCVSDEDEYGRKLRYVWLQKPLCHEERNDCEHTAFIRDHLLNALLIQAGTARAKSYPPDTALDELFESLEERGRSQRCVK